MQNDTTMPINVAEQNDKTAHRLSVSLSAEQHRELCDIAQKNRVSVAWVVREAIDRLLQEDVPLLRIGNK